MPLHMTAPAPLIQDEPERRRQRELVACRLDGLRRWFECCRLGRVGVGGDNLVGIAETGRLLARLLEPAQQAEAHGLRQLPLSVSRFAVPRSSPSAAPSQDVLIVYEKQKAYLGKGQKHSSEYK